MHTYTETHAQTHPYALQILKRSAKRKQNSSTWTNRLRNMPMAKKWDGEGRKKKQQHEQEQNAKTSESQEEKYTN